MSSIPTSEAVTFFDCDNDQEAAVIVRSVTDKVALCISLEKGGDIEVMLSPSQAKLVVDALQKAVASMNS